MASQSLDELISTAHNQTGLDQSVIESWFDSHQQDEYDIVDQYWIESPFVFSEIQYNEAHDSYRYVIHLPDIGSELTTQTDVIEELINVSQESITQSTYTDLATMICAVAEVSDRIDGLSTVDGYCIAYLLKIRKSPIGRIQGIVADANIGSVHCSGDQAQLRVYHHEYGQMPSNLSLSTTEIREFIHQVESQTNTEKPGEVINLDSKTVFFGDDNELSDTVSFSIESYNRGNVSPIELIQSGMFSAEEMGYLWEMVSYGGNIAIVGGTSSGKSLTVNAIGNFIPTNNRVVSVEEQREIELDHPYWTPMSPDEGELTAEVIKKSLRVRPDYVLFDEIRGEGEATTLFEASMTGHSIAFTMHAPDAEECITRLAAPPLDVPRSHLTAIDIVVSVSQYIQDGDSILRCSEIVEPEEDWTGVDDSLLNTSIGEWDTDRDIHSVDSSKSVLLREIAESQLTTGEAIVERINLRSEILSYMAEEDLDGVSDITAVVAAFDADPELPQQSLNIVDTVGEWVTQSINGSDSNTDVISAE